MNDLNGPFFDVDHSPFCPATGKLARLCKGGGGKAPKAQASATAAASETPQLVGQAVDDDYSKEQERKKRNEAVLASGAEATFGQKLKLGQ